MTYLSMRSRLLASSMISGVALFAIPATGVRAAEVAVAARDTTVGELVVTGSRIPTPNLSSVSPITSISSTDIKLEGATDAVSVLDQLPQAGQSINNTPNPLQSSAGFATVNLRNLAPVRTLVLIDGRRLMPGDPTSGGESPDIDTVPAQLIDRVEVVTGGASAVYGSDAIAGVVNFIMKHNFEGVQLDVQYGGALHDNGDASGLGRIAKNSTCCGPITVPTGTAFDGQTINFSALIGTNSADGKGNVEAYLSYKHADPVHQSQRDYSICQYTTGGNVPDCTGSGNSNYFSGDSGKVYSVSGAAPNNMFIPRGSQLTTPPALFNSNPYEYLSRGDERYQGGFFANYAAAPWAVAYADFSFMDDRTRINVAPSALFRQTYAVNCDNPLLSAQQVSLECPGGVVSAADANLLIGRRNVEGGPRMYDYDHLSYRAVIGLRGDFGDAWHYDAYGQFGYTKYLFSVQNDLSIKRVSNALQVVANPAVGGVPGVAAGVPVCKVALSGADTTCVPYDIFADGGVTSAATNYIGALGTQTGDTQEQIVSGNITGDLGHYGLKSPWATDGVGINLGAEYRREELALRADEEFASGDLSGAGQAALPVNGSFDVKELFGEIRVPLAQNAPFIENLSFDGGYRFSHYSRAGDTSAYKLALDYSPVEDVRFRGSFQRAVRAPDVQELFTPPTATGGLTVPVDPCAPGSVGNNSPATATLAQCMNTGVTAAQYGDGRDPAIGGTDKIPQCTGGQCGTLTGGNVNLKPETSKTYSFGAVVRPRFLPGFTASIDYFSIDITSAIGTFPNNFALNDCLTAGTFCNLVDRASNGALFNTTNQVKDGGYIVGTNVNIGFIKTTGVDFTANYRFDLDKFGFENRGKIGLDFNGTYTHSFIQQPAPGGPSFDCAGFFGPNCSVTVNIPQAFPKWRHSLRLTWESPWNVTVSGQWRFISAVTAESNSSNPALGSGPGSDPINKLPAVSYFDLSANWKVKAGVVLRAGVNNIFDKDPPIVDDNLSGSGSPNTFPIYDILGRTVFVGLTAAF